MWANNLHTLKSIIKETEVKQPDGKNVGNQQDHMEEFRGCPMLQKELQELSQVNCRSARN
jgi:hypothetical protein